MHRHYTANHYAAPFIYCALRRYAYPLTAKLLGRPPLVTPPLAKSCACHKNIFPLGSVPQCSSEDVSDYEH